MAIYGYSERGVINSLIFSIGDDSVLMGKFIALLEISELKDLGTPEEYIILLEQSFSQFGDADLVIKICYPDSKLDKVLFIEGKVKTALRSHWKLENQFARFNLQTEDDKYKDYVGYSSNLFFQLHLKKIMSDNADDILKSGFAEEPRFEKLRKIGENEIVKKALKIISNCQAFYIGLVPSSQSDINAFIEENSSTGIHFLPWEKVYQFSKDNNLEKVIMNFDYNENQIFNLK